jgi:MYXO-CTERM domain-containing protein
LVVATTWLALAGDAAAWEPLHQCGDNWYSAWAEDDAPNYQINVDGAGTNGATLAALGQAAFALWGEPCCSSVAATYGGTTTRLPTEHGDGWSVIGFLDEGWPPEFGNPRDVLGVTLPTVWPNCRITEADIIFNEQYNDFCYDRCRVGDTAFATVLTHEVGHLLGLAHTSNHRAIMYYTYIGQIEPRLATDDIEGICTLYPDDECGLCTRPGDCAAPLVCDEGRCGLPDSCYGVSCAEGETCRGGTCVADGDCLICVSCDSDVDCGPTGFCLRRSDGETVCSQYCAAGGSCPGDSVCVDGEGGETDVRLCVNPGATGIDDVCPATYECTDCADTGCPEGQQCFDGACRPETEPILCTETINGPDCLDLCPSGADGCLQISASRVICTARCFVDADCGPCGTCVDVGGGQARACVNHDWGTVGVCPAEWECQPPRDAGADTGAMADAGLDATVDGQVNGHRDAEVHDSGIGGTPGGNTGRDGDPRDGDVVAPGADVHDGAMGEGESSDRGGCHCRVTPGTTAGNGLLWAIWGLVALWLSRRRGSSSQP